MCGRAVLYHDVTDADFRIGDRPSKVHVSDALEAFREFCEKQYLNLALARGKATARRGGSRAGGPRSGSGPSGPASPSLPHTTPHGPSHPIESVD